MIGSSDLKTLLKDEGRGGIEGKTVEEGPTLTHTCMCINVP